MACYAAVASLVNLLDNIVHRDRYQDLGIGILGNILVPLFVKFKHLKGFLRDHSTRDNKVANDGQTKIRDIAYEVQDMIQYEIHRRMTTDSSHFTNKIIEEIIECLERVEQLIGSLMEDMMAVEEGQISKELEHFEHHSLNTRALDPTRPCENAMVGFDKYLIPIKDELCGQSSKLQVIPIVGMGGIGKTTLARNVFNDSLIVHHFDLRGWVSISQDYSLSRVLLSLMRSFCIKEFPGKNDVALKEKIYKYLKGRRYLIVIDDIWSIEVWDDLKWIFPDDHDGSRILLTSRLEKVACYCGSFDSHHQIEFLNENESWNLLRSKVFEQEHCPPELDDIGKLIAKKCRGLPLAIVVIAGVLSKDRTQNRWKEIERNLHATLSGNDNELSNIILSLSYNQLPQHLKSCFLYIGRFPEDYEIKISRLINLWIAEGFIESSNGSKRLEEVAEECLQDLVKRSLILVTKRKSSGEFKFCVMHDVLRNFCKMQGLHEKFFHVKNNIEHANLSSRDVRRINLIIHDYNSQNRANWGISSINGFTRSIIFFGDNYQDFNDDGIFGSFILLEILDLLDMPSKVIPAVFQLSHLKYLALTVSDSNFFIPPSISKLQNLQTLIIFEKLASLHFEFPIEIWEIQQLRNLITGRLHEDWGKIMLPAPPCITVDGQLENLQTLSGLMDFIFTNDVIRMIPNIRTIKCVYSKSGINGEWDSHGLHNLIHLHLLENLSIYFTFKYWFVPFPDHFTFPLSLKKLCLYGTTLMWEELSVVGLLPNLQVLKLKWNAVIGDEWEPMVGEFVQLKVLLLSKLNLKHWRAESTHFPCLEYLKIRSCDDLVEIPLDIGNIPTLRFIHICYGHIGLIESALRIRKDQESMGNDVQVRQDQHDGQVLVHPLLCIF